MHPTLSYLNSHTTILILCTCPYSYPYSSSYYSAVFEACCSVLERLLRPQDAEYLDQQTEYQENVDLSRNQNGSASGSGIVAGNCPD